MKYKTGRKSKKQHDDFLYYSINTHLYKTTKNLSTPTVSPWIPLLHTTSAKRQGLQQSLKSGEDLKYNILIFT